MRKRSSRRTFLASSQQIGHLLLTSSSVRSSLNAHYCIVWLYIFAPSSSEMEDFQYLDEDHSSSSDGAYPGTQALSFCYAFIHLIQDQLSTWISFCLVFRLCPFNSLRPSHVPDHPRRLNPFKNKIITLFIYYGFNFTAPCSLNSSGSVRQPLRHFPFFSPLTHGNNSWINVHI